jgi:hypothetical protein
VSAVLSPMADLTPRERAIADDVQIEAAMQALHRCQQLHRSRTLAFLPVVDLVEKAKAMGVRIVLTHDPELPNGVSIEFEPLNTPAWLELKP